MNRDGTKGKKRKIRWLLSSALFILLISPWLGYLLTQFLNAAASGSINHTILDVNYFHALCSQKNGSTATFSVVTGVLMSCVVALITTDRTSKLSSVGMMKVTDDISIPVSAGNGQHGSERFLTEKEKRDLYAVYTPGEKFTGKAGLVINYEKIGRKERFYYIKDDLHSMVIGTTGAGKDRRVMLTTLLETYILELDGDSDSDPLLVLVRNSKAMLVISAGALITNLLVKWSDSLCSYITDSVTYSFNAAGLATALIANIKFGWFSLVFVIVFAVIVLICCLVALIRGVELGLMKILLPIMACNLTSIKQDRWNDFFASFIVVAFGYIVQMILFKLAMTYAIEGDPLALLKSLVCLFFFIKTPNWLQKFAYSSGLKDTARSGMYLGMMMGRRL